MGYAVFLTLALFFSTIIRSLCLNHYFWRGFKIGIQVKGALTTEVYRKAFLLSNEARQESTVGEIVNLESVDSKLFQDMIPYLHLRKKHLHFFKFYVDIVFSFPFSLEFTLTNCV